LETKTEVLFDPFSKQIEFLEAVFSKKYTTIMYGGSIRGGKTFAGIGALLMLCKMYPKSRWAIVRDSLQTLKRNTLPSFNKICPDGFKKSYNQDTQTVTFQNGSQILFFSENYDDDKELNRWKGLEVNGFLLEEVNELNELSFYKAKERAGSHVIPNKPPPLIICTCNPANNWVKTLFFDRWEKGSLPSDWIYIPSKIFDNPFVTADKVYMKSLEDLPRYQYEIFVEGNWNYQKRTGAEFYKEFDLDENVKSCPYDPTLPIWLSVDENVNPYLPATLWQLHGKEAWCIDEIALKNPRNTTRDLGKEFSTRYHDHAAGVFIGGDATSQKEDVKQEKGMNLFRLIQNELEKFKPSLRVLKSNPNVVTRQQFMNTIFYNQKRNEPFKGIKIYFDSRCKITIQDYLNVKEDPISGKGKYKNEKDTDADSGVTYQKYGHMSDSGDYFLTFVFASEYEGYQKGGKTSNIKTGRSVSTNSY
jgi:hypothetical protein